MSSATGQRELALEVLQQLRAAGYEALWAGGCVRDQLLGHAPKDYDVATTARPDEIRALFGQRRTLPIGASFGVITVLGRKRQGQIDVATFRTDESYSDGRRPDSVRFTTAEHDAERRDFTINGLFYDPVQDEVVDYVGGRADLDRKLVRAIGDPHQRFAEDKLRMLRAIRFAATYGFTIEPATLAAIQSMAAEVTAVSAERIGAEIRRMLLHANRVIALDLLREAQLLPHVLPEVAALHDSALHESRRVLRGLVEPTLATSLAALLLCRPEAAGTLGRRLRFTNREIERTSWLLEHLAVLRDAPSVSWPRLQRILTHDGAPELVALHAAIAGSDDAALAFVRERLLWPAEKLNPPLLVDGSDLIRHGLEPGPEFSRLLEAVRDAQLNGEIATTDEALAHVERLRAGEKSPGT